MKIAYISTYLPRHCGIATFTNDIYTHIDQNARFENHEQHLFALIEEDDMQDYPEQVVFKIRSNIVDDYKAAADFINANGYDLCVVQHEYGIYGGESGNYILSLIQQINIPLISILHTILERPSAEEKAVMVALAHRSSKLVVMNTEAIRILQSIFHVSNSKIKYIPHGVPDFPKTQKQAKEELGLAGKRVILTFGFIGRSKGIEVALKALPSVVQDFSETVYLVVGKTHPNILKSVGEEYREHLVELTKELKIDKNVQFVNKFVDDELLSTYLSACDIYITPYVGEAQITSGTLSFAIGAGAAILSTPYLHAKELLSGGRGILFPFNDSKKLSEELIALFSSVEKLDEYRRKSIEFGKTLSWSALVETYIDLFVDSSNTSVNKEDITLGYFSKNLPPFNLSHIKRLTNQVGIIQHATYAIPNYKEGYCLDDNARALLLVLSSYEKFEDPESLQLLSTYLAYINHAQLDDGRFRNFLSFDNQFLDDVGSDDSFGRTIWAIGYLFKKAPNVSFYHLGKELFFRSIPHFSKLKSIRAVAYTALGIMHYLDHHPNDQRLIGELNLLIEFIIHEYNAHQNDEWQWYEEIISYDNAILPLAVLRAQIYLDNDRLKRVGEDTAMFLDKLLFKNGYLSVIGNEGWYTKTGVEVAKFGQQPIEVCSIILLYSELYKMEGDNVYLEKSIRAFQWFLGVNVLKLELYDSETHGCCDGLERHGVNFNQGAESTICYWLSYVVVYETLMKYKS